MISIRHLSKFFGTRQALKDVSLEVNAGEVIGFLGRNGAGKTTLMRILCGYLSPSEGEVAIDGKLLRNGLGLIQRQIGYLPEHPPLYPALTVEEYVTLAARLRGVEFIRLKTSVDQALEDCLLKDVRRQIIATLSKGYQQRVGIAQAIVHDPKILILDEPTSGLDPVQVAQIRDLIRRCEGRRTVILSTHVLSEIEQLVRRVVIIKSGSLALDDTMERLHQSAVRRCVIRLKGDMSRIQAYFQKRPDDQALISVDDGLVCIDMHLPSAEAALNPVLKGLMDMSCDIRDVRQQLPSLEQVFLDLHA